MKVSYYIRECYSIRVIEYSLNNESKKSGKNLI